ncbi:uncharacterized protein GGS22DRAFT_188296 [Annulohypoxylon maeteangense]|uniref:uncharacterized protein n=1 Tax=Annulohypoxylon maeteangense TaxID=1927788 RepID=UPI002008D9F0|nr:uncharacterized protein GGS22DRAFT_188296 [Annulohypoxylon maeteangense]KAI0885017.1 hypothetical protein GGS22DRAFT_188296 [Annulohypoxylon maeteangense]
MWFRLLAMLICVSSIVVGQDLPGPGKPANAYSNGSFTEPNGELSTYLFGSSMNITWETKYDTVDLSLIIGWDFSNRIPLALNIAQTWHLWDVVTSSQNSSQIYTFIIINATGSDYDKRHGGFLSATFWIQLTYSASASSTTSSASAIVFSASSQPMENASDGQLAGLTEGAKVGVGVGVGVGGIGLISLAAGMFLYRRSRDRKTQATGNIETLPQGTGPGSLYFNNNYKTPVEMQDTGRMEIQAR